MGKAMRYTKWCAPASVIFVAELLSYEISLVISFILVHNEDESFRSACGGGGCGGQCWKPH